MELTGQNLYEFTKELSSDSPAPGGGSVAALNGSLGIALTNMVSSLTVGKKTYAEHEELNQTTLKEASQLRIDFLEAINRDVEIFAQMSNAFQMPKSTDEEKENRRDALEEASKACSVVPMEIMEMALSALKITEKIIGKSNKSASSDIGVAALNLKASIQGAWLNILINIGSIKDEAFVNEYRQKGEKLLEEALPLADRIYEEIKSKL